MIFDKSKYNQAVAFLTELFSQDKRVRIEKVKEKRSLDQNALYWLWLTCVQNETGNDKDELHIFFTKKFLPIIERKVFNEIIYDRTSTTSLDTFSFKQYLDKIQLFSAQELGITLPDPSDKDFERFKDTYKDYL